MDSQEESTTVRRRGQPEQANGNAHPDVSKKNNGVARDVQPQELRQTTLSILQIWAPTLALIFGGCCSNVYTLESLISASPSAGSLITFFQFLLVTLFTLPRHVDLSSGPKNLFLKERNIPLRKWLWYTAYFLAINILNNMAFKYKISVPLHIILRSAGPVTTMLAGRVLRGRKYPPQKILAVVLLFSGVVLAAISDAWSKQDSSRAHVAKVETAPERGHAAWSQAPGFVLLATALTLSACMGLYTDEMYAEYGRSTAVTAETLLYSHALSLPYFFSQIKPLFFEFTNLMQTPAHQYARPPKTNLGMQTFSPLGLLDLGSTIMPRPFVLLLLNAITQVVCIVGVNRLSTQSSSLTVSIVLNIRKLVSLVLSILLFGNKLPLGVMVGASIVFLGGGLYALPTAKTGANREKKKV
jgi:solute carrier family 35 (UDP-xylose/UDP-N-acetylglucosamine transporter), member B4